ncbi:hypothetical protein ACTWPB_08470 [Nocardia sp. IBHARD005]|uniref:hypothetical protein n=1 Tax=Nocardia sp. IBHARD005 TaxID=3457765 RepID=UPI004059B524
MTALSTRNRIKAAALLGSAAVITAMAGGIATADPGSPSHGGERSTNICTEHGGGAHDHPGQPGEPGRHFQHVGPGEPGRTHAEPGHLSPRVDGRWPGSGSADSRPGHPF